MQYQKPSSPISVFCVAAPPDATLLAQWETHLLPLEQARYLTIWSELHLPAGAVRTQQLYKYLGQADLIILLVSADFFASDECMALMKRALRSHEYRQTCVVPLLLRPVVWHKSPLALLSCLPSNNVPVTQWTNQDAAFRECVQGIICALGQTITSSLVPGRACELALTIPRVLSTREQLDLADILLKSLMMSERGARETVIALLPDEIVHNIRRSDNSRIDIVNIIKTCSMYSNGVETLLQIIRSLEGNSLTMGRIDEFVKSLFYE